MGILACVTLFAIHLLVSASAEQRILNEYIRHYDPLTYSATLLHNDHLRAKRSVGNVLRLNFEAHGRVFDMRLQRDVSTFHSDVKHKNDDGSLSPHDVSHIYEGSLWGQKDTFVHGSVIEGVFSGHIDTPVETYYVDRSEIYFKDPQKFHSVIYAAKDLVHDPHSRHKRAAEGLHHTCGVNNPDIRAWMESIQTSGSHERVKRNAAADSSAHSIHQRETWEASNIYTPWEQHSVHKRAVAPPVNLTCHLFLQSDPMMWNYMTKSVLEKGLGYGAVRAKEEITSLFATHVRAIRSIYENTKFETKDKSALFVPVSFVVYRVKIYEFASACEKPGETPSDFCKPNIDVSNFLNLNSRADHSEYCLAYMFTYRDFAGGTLGLAWVGSPTGASGGICDLYKTYEESGRQVKKSLNTGIITLINYGNRVPPKISSLTFAHEVGHNFGASHDPVECQPYAATPPSANGNYIMFASATSGDKENNDHFSACSRHSMALVLRQVVEGQEKRSCFVHKEGAFCGNKIVEGDEACDCGYDAADCTTDRCCHPRHHAQPCQLAENVACSPTKGPCCSKDCNLIRKESQKLCRIESSCSYAAYCDGEHAVCPSSEPKDNMTACNLFTQVCISGICIGSICQKIGWEQCYITLEENSNNKNPDREKLCYVACRNPAASGGECVSTGDTKAVNKPENSPLKEFLEQNTTSDGMKNIQLRPGAPCDNYRGYCDVFQKCRGIDADGPLARLKNLFLNAETLNTIKDWIVKYWWAVLLMGLGLVIFMGIFIHLCAVHTPSSNPNRKAARTLSGRRRPQAGHRAGGGARGGAQGGYHGQPPPKYELRQMNR